MKTLIVIFSMVFIIMACEKDITLEVPDAASVLVVNGIVSPEAGAVVDISNSVRPSDAKEVKGIQDAIVNLFEDDLLIGSLNYEPLESEYIENPKSYYQNPDLLIQAGKMYRLEVEHPSYENVKASTRIPYVGIEQPGLAFLGSDQEGRHQFSVNIVQAMDGKQYFSMLLSNRRKPYEIVNGQKIYDEFAVDTVRQVFSFAGSEQSDLINTGLDSYQATNDFFSNTFSNDFFNQGRGELVIEAFGLTYSDSETFGISQELWVEVRQISFESYEYIRTLSIQESVANDPFASEIIVFNNIENGLGNFGGFSSIRSNKVVLD